MASTVAGASSIVPLWPLQESVIFSCTPVHPSRPPTTLHRSVFRRITHCGPPFPVLVYSIPFLSLLPASTCHPDQPTSTAVRPRTRAFRRSRTEAPSLAVRDQ